jgi:hypothetical protein
MGFEVIKAPVSFSPCGRVESVKTALYEIEKPFMDMWMRQPRLISLRLHVGKCPSFSQRPMREPQRSSDR